MLPQEAGLRLVRRHPERTTKRECTFGGNEMEIRRRKRRGPSMFQQQQVMNISFVFLAEQQPNNIVDKKQRG